LDFTKTIIPLALMVFGPMGYILTQSPFGLEE